MFYYSLKTEDKIDSKEEQTELENNPDEEDMDDANINNKRERPWRYVFEEN